MNDLIVYFIKNIDLIDEIKFTFQPNNPNKPIIIIRKYIKSIKNNNPFYLDKSEKK